MKIKDSNTEITFALLQQLDFFHYTVVMEYQRLKTVKVEILYITITI